MADQFQLVDIVLPLEQSEQKGNWLRLAAKQLRVAEETITDMRLVKHSIDARKAAIMVRLRLEVALGGKFIEQALAKPEYPTVPSGAKRVVIVGCGPAGMFAALRCIELGRKPVIVERGKDVSTRRFDLAPILREGRVIEDSNYCFGEGGAGTFSDGKLYTRAKKRGPVRDVYETLVAHGAPPKILTDAHPHVGSNLLPNVVKAMRESILAAGGEVYFGSRVTGFIKNAQGDALCGVVTHAGKEITGEGVILATGHSARDIYRLLVEHGIALEQKPFAVGVRIEHPQELIDSIQYSYERGLERHPMLPAARYRLATKIRGRGVHSFCMCPGGFVVPAATENDEVVVNGMSLARRANAFANSGIVVTVEPEDTQKYQKDHGVLAGIAYQKELEIIASQAGGGMQKAPAQRVADFFKGKISSNLPKTSYFPGLNSVDLNALLPEEVKSRLAQGLKLFGKQMRGYTSHEANLIGFETRTSSPVRIPRGAQSLEHPEMGHFIPCGEGAGYAGGIVSAALDGMRCAEAACAW